MEEGKAEEGVEIELGELVGQTEEDLAVEEENESKDRQADQERKEHDEKVAAIMAQDLSPEERAAALQKLFKVGVETF